MKLFLSVLYLNAMALGIVSGTERPNVVFIYADDHSQAAISAYGSVINKTPNIDTLAREGVMFTNSFVANSICGPARATILTGLHSHANGQTGNRSKFKNDLPTFSKLMQAQGYQTAMVGKWHVNAPPTGFDFHAITHGYYIRKLNTSEGPVKVNGYTTEVVTDTGLGWLQKRDKEKPFVLWLCHNAVHRTWEPAPKYLHHYDDVTIPEPETLFDDYAGKNKGAARAQMRVSKDLFPAYDLKLPVTGKGVLDRNAEGKLRSLTPEERQAWHAAFGPKNEAFARAGLSGKALTSWNYQRYIKNYLRCVDAVDDSVGKVMEYLKEQGLDENTLVIYSSDQGFFLGEHGWYDKRWMYEPSLRTPLIVRWPGQATAGMRPDALVQNIDMAPTLLAAAGIAVPPGMQGKSLLPLLSGEKPEDWRDAIYYHYQMNDGTARTSHVVARHYGIRTDRYKLMYAYDHQEWELYDLAKDPREMNNRVGNPEYAQRVVELRSRLKTLRKDMGDQTGKDFD